MKVAVEVVIAVSVTDNSTLALDKEDMKLDMFPPGQAATSIMPMATMGVIWSFKSTISKNVMAGSRINWQVSPKIADLGFLKTFLNSAGLMPRATPNITSANTKLITLIPLAEKLSRMGSRFNSCSYMHTNI